MQATNLQEKLLANIIDRYERRSDAIDDLARILNSSKDPIYRRLRNETLLTPEEIALLALHFNISLDRLVFTESSKLICSFKPISKKVRNFEEYLTLFNRDFERVRRMPNLKMYSASSEIPILTTAYFPELLGFKLYIWGKTFWNFEYLQDRPFSFDLITEPVRRTIQESQSYYTSVETIELMSVNAIDMTLSQIEYQLYSDGFGNPQWVNHMKDMVTVGKKFSTGYVTPDRMAPFHLYHNEIFFSTNITSMVSDLGPVAYFTYNGPHFMRTTDQRFCSFTNNWFESVMAKSNQMTQVSERTRDWFFREMYKKIDRVKQRLLVHIDDGH
jgi:hypothetical protein